MVLRVEGSNPFDRPIHTLFIFSTLPYTPTVRTWSVIAVGLFVIIGYFVADKPGDHKAILASAPSSSSSAEPSEPIAPLPLIIVGEGGDVGTHFGSAAQTYARERGGEIHFVHGGDEFIQVMKSFVQTHGLIQTFVYYGHGNEVGLYVNQTPGVNGGVYANDPDLNKEYKAASIYELPRTLFAPDSTAIFYGCNVAHNNGYNDSFAEAFANHFSVKVTASEGPTEFSLLPDKHEPPPLKANVETLYMLPSINREGFVILHPSPADVGGFSDVHESSAYANAIHFVTKKELGIGSGSFLPYKNITYGEAKEFCKLVNAQAPCSIEGMNENELLRNTAALKLLLDASGVVVKKSTSGYDGYIYFGSRNNLLTENFVRKRWYTRAELAALTQSIIEFTELQ